jgi:PAS domain S-box-containing protein
MAPPARGAHLVPSESLLRAVIESAPNGVVMVDRAGRIVLVNAEIERLFGYQRRELLDMPIEALVPDRDRHAHHGFRAGYGRDPQKRLMGAGRDLFGLHKDGREVPVEIGLTPIATDDGLFVLASVIDIGPRKKAEQELRSSVEELERFAYVASHDLQEPLRTVASYVQLLARRYRSELGTDGAEFIDFAVDGVHRMQRLIEDLLAFSRVGTNPEPVHATPVGRALEVALGSLRASIDESSAIITHDPLPDVLADPSQLEHLFTNLIGNALKFRGEAPPLVHVGARRVGPFWEISVRDRGIGIEPRYFDRIFVIFQRLHVQEQYPGTGVGLAICRKIVERNGGRIWVDSAPGNGATFSFTLPAAQEATDVRRDIDP